jgi:EF-hand domain pair
MMNVVMPKLNFAKTAAFRKMCDNAFNKIDENGDGEIDLNELTLATCYLHYKLCRKSPGVTEPPSSEVVAATLERYDMDKTGALSRPEFHEFARRWFSEKGAAFFQRLLVTSFIWMVVLPESAGILHRELPAARKIPKAIFKVVFGVSTSGATPLA